MLVVHSSRPRIIASPSGSAILLLRDDIVVAGSTGSDGPPVPIRLEAGSRIPAQTVPTRLPLVGCLGATLTPGAYALRAVVGYGSDPLNAASDETGGSFVLVSPPVPLQIC